MPPEETQNEHHYWGGSPALLEPYSSKAFGRHWCCYLQNFPSMQKLRSDQSFWCNGQVLLLIVCGKFECSKYFWEIFQNHVVAQCFSRRIGFYENFGFLLLFIFL